MYDRPDTREEILSLPGCSPGKLREWARADLIPRPRQFHEAGRRGSGSAYPPETASLVQALIARRHAEPRIDTRSLGIAVWFEGHPVSIEVIRRSLCGIIGEMATELQHALDKADENALDKADENHLVVGEDGARCASQPAAMSRFARLPIIREMKRNVGDRDDFMLSAIPSLVLLLYGQQPIWRSPDEEDHSVKGDISTEQVLARLFGDEHRTAQGLKDDETLVATPLRRLLIRIQQEVFCPLFERTHATLDSLTDEEIIVARDTARTLIDDGGRCVEALEREHGRGAFGVGVLRVYRETPRDWHTRALLIAGLALMRRAATVEENETYDSIRQSLRDAARQVSL